MKLHARPIPLAILLVTATCASCAVPPTPLRLDPVLRRWTPSPGMGSIFFSASHTLWTDREPATAAALDRAAEEECHAVAALFQLPFPVPLLLEAYTPAHGTEPPGVRGYTVGPAYLVILLPAVLEGSALVEDFRSALRHEIAHLASDALFADGPTPADWLSEGLAHYVEDMRPGPRGLRPPAALALLVGDRAIPLPALLDWRVDLDALRAGRTRTRPDLRRLATAFLAYLLEHSPSSQSFPARLRGIADRSRASLLAEQESFRRWLAAAS